MPFYLFRHPKTQEVREIFFHMNDEKKFIDTNGEQWVREFTVPQASIDANIDPYSSKAFVEKTRRAGTIGDLVDMSKEMSERRGGIKNDQIKKDHIKQWKKDRNLTKNKGYTPRF